MTPSLCDTESWSIWSRGTWSLLLGKLFGQNAWFRRRSSDLEDSPPFLTSAHSIFPDQTTWAGIIEEQSGPAYRPRSKSRRRTTWESADNRWLFRQPPVKTESRLPVHERRLWSSRFLQEVYPPKTEGSVHNRVIYHGSCTVRSSASIFSDLDVPGCDASPPRRSSCHLWPSLRKRCTCSSHLSPHRAYSRRQGRPNKNDARTACTSCGCSPDSSRSTSGSSGISSYSQVARHCSHCLPLLFPTRILFTGSRKVRARGCHNWCRRSSDMCTSLTWSAHLGLSVRHRART